MTDTVTDTVTDQPTVGEPLDLTATGDGEDGAADDRVAHVAREVEEDMRQGVRSMIARAVDAEIGARRFAESAESERASGVLYREKAHVLNAHLVTLGIEPVDIDSLG